MSGMTYQDLLELLMTLPEEQLQQDVLFVGFGFIADVDWCVRGDDPDITEYSQGLVADDQMVLKAASVVRELHNSLDIDPEFLKDDEEPEGLDGVVLPDEAGFEIEMIEEKELDTDGTMDS